MQVFGLPGHLIRSARSASRLLAAKTPDIEAERRRDAVARWLMARAAGLTAEAAARAVGASRSTLHRWRRRAAPLGLLVAALTADPSAVPVSRPTRIALLLTLRLGFRALETCSLEWRAVSLDGDQPAVSVTTSKTAAGLRTLPLPPAAVEELRQLKKAAGKNAAYLFPAEPGSKRALHLHPESLSRAFARTCARLGIAGASTHDLRRTSV